jgi:hypothetical protein
MEEKRFQVEVLSIQRALYSISAPDAEAAERLAMERWQNGEPTDLTGHDWSELQAVDASEAPDVSLQAQDDEIVLRFVRERERLVARMGGDTMNGAGPDAISASQVASDLGWACGVQDGMQRPDSVRAAQALERLCGRKELVCFERPRVRAGERGDIRLYCTPAYLDSLSQSMTGIRSATTTPV